MLYATNIDNVFTEISAWCIKNENIHCVLLGASSVDQLYENMQALQVSRFF